MFAFFVEKILKYNIILLKVVARERVSGFTPSNLFLRYNFIGFKQMRRQIALKQKVHKISYKQYYIVSFC